MRHLTILLLLTCLFGNAAAQVPSVMNYQGRLTDNSPGQAPVDATLPMEFRIYGSAMGSDLEWSESWAGGVSVTSGIFSVMLGSNGAPLPTSLFTGGSARYLEIEIDGEILMPRQQLGANGWAHQAGSALDAESLGGLPDTSWQRRVSGTCPAGQSIRSISATGAVTCEPDDVGSLTEVDPSVASTTTDRVPRWDGAALGDGSIVDTGAAVQHTTPVVMDSTLGVAGRLATGANVIENGLFSGVLTGVDLSDLPGWTSCYTATYATVTDGPSLRTACTDDLILLGCRQVGLSTLTAAAMGHRKDVFFDTGNNSTATHSANGVNWYHHDNLSVGFANAGTAVNKATCDFLGDVADERLCWHLSGIGGYRCGASTGLNGSTGWIKEAYQRSSAGSHVGPQLYDEFTDSVSFGDVTVDGNLALPGLATGAVPYWNGVTLAYSGISAVGGSLQVESGTVDDDATMGGLADDWISLSGYIQMRSNTDSYGIVLRDKDTSSYFGLTQVDGVSYLADNATSGDYFLRGNGANATVRGTLGVQADQGMLGTHPSYGSGYTGLWRSGADYNVLANATHTYINAPSATGNIYFRSANSTKATLFGSSGELDVSANLDVGGTALLGLERVSAAGTVGTTSQTCTSGGWTCYTGNVTVTCPAGKRVLGGGCSCNGATDAVCYDYPVGDDRWYCAMAEDSPSVGFTVYALCARVGN